MMFFVSAKRLQAILAVDRKEQEILWRSLKQYELNKMAAHLFDVKSYSEHVSQPVLTAIDQRVAAKKALTKAARPPHQPRKKK